MSCCVPKCVFRNKHLKISRFRFPRDPALKSQWDSILEIKKSHKNSYVCRRHFKDCDVIDTWVSGKGVNAITVKLKQPRLRAGTLPIKASEMYLHNGGSIYLNDVSTLSNNTATGSMDVQDSISSINSDHCYTTAQIQDNNVAEVNNDSAATPINNLKRDAPLFNVQITSSFKRMKPSEPTTWW